jgi:sigma-B regulation protein RsbU (phosphoserine phosphatase)
VKLGVKLALAMTALVAAVVVTAIWSMGFYLRREVEQQLAADIDRTGKVLEEVQRSRVERLAEQNRVIADEPRLKAVVNSAEVDVETVTDVARDMREVANSDILILTSPEGAIRANVGAREKQLSIPPGYLRPADTESGSRVFTAAWPLEGELYLVTGRAVTLADRTAGILITGAQVNNTMAELIRRQTNTEVVLLTQNKLTATALDQHLTSHRNELTEAVHQAAGGSRTQATQIRVAGQSYLVRFAAVDGLDSKLDPKTAAETYFVMLRSLDEALKPYYQIRNFLFKLGFFAFAVAILAALVIANTLSRRVSRLASATSLVAGGDLDISVPVGGNDEIGSLGRAFNDMIAKLRISRDELRSKERLERELEIATVIQTLLLPAQPALDGFDVAARMVPAEEVGGDFYDVHQASGGSWVAIGDVSGHGVTPGLIMMMVQSMLSALARQSPEVGQKYTPKEVLRIINSALHDNLRTRMHDDNYMTMVLLKHVGNGKFRYAGAHESLLIYRRATHQVETLSTDGTWLGLQDDIGAFLEEHEIDLAPGDALVLYTDGITEAKNPQGVQYNIDRLRDMLLRQGSMSMPSAQKIRDGIVDDVMTWSRTRQDDVTVMVLRRLES